MQLLRPLYYIHYIQNSQLLYNVVFILKLKFLAYVFSKCHFKKRKVAFFYFLFKKNVKTYSRTMGHSGDDIKINGVLLRSCQIPTSLDKLCLWSSWFMAIMVVAVMVIVCGRHGLWPSLLNPRHRLLVLLPCSGENRLERFTEKWQFSLLRVRMLMCFCYRVRRNVVQSW